MTVQTYQIPGGSRVLLFSCDDCGAPALFGTHCNVRAALKSGDVSRAGRWFCGQRDGRPTCIAEPAP